MDFHAFHLPAGVADHAPLRVVAERNGIRALAPELTAADVTRTCDALLDARRTLTALPVARVIAAIDEAARSLREPGAATRADLLRALTALTGYSPEMAELVLDRIGEDWLAPALHRLIRRELGDAAAIEGFLVRDDGSRVRAVAPPLGLHVFAGNVPGVGVSSIVRALLVRSAVLAKSAAGEPVLAAAFARALHRVDAAVGAAVAVTWWRGGSAELESAALARAQLVVHYGGEAAIRSLRARAETAIRFIEHGPRISFAVVAAAGCDLEAAAAETAHAVALFDQQGCVSPQLAYVIGTANHAKRFAAAVADALRLAQQTLPRGRLEPGEAAAIRELRTRAEFRAISGEDIEVWGDDATPFTVVYDPDPAFAGTCLNRTLLVKHVAATSDVIPLAAPFGPFLQTVGIAGFGADAEAFAAALGELGASRITRISAMPWPPVDWHHDGRGPLRELVRWIDLE